MAAAKPNTTPRKQATQAALIDAAYGLFSTKGFNTSTTREIAEQAKVNELTLFRHFQNKYNLLSQVIQKYSTVALLEEEMKRIETMTFEEGFHHFARFFLTQLEAKYPMIRLMIIESRNNPQLKAIIGPIPVKLRQTLMKHLERGVKEGQVRDGLDLELVAQSFLWIFLSYIITRSDVGPAFCPFPPEEVAQASTEIFLRGLKP